MRRAAITLFMGVLVATGCDWVQPTYAYLDPDDPTVQELVQLNEKDPQAAKAVLEEVLAKQNLPAKVQGIETRIDELTGKLEEVRAVIAPVLADLPEGAGSSLLTELIPDPVLRSIAEILLGVGLGGAAAQKVRQGIRKKYPKKPTKKGA